MRADDDSVDELFTGLLQISRFHREHERFHARGMLQVASELQREATALHILADRWFEVAAAGGTDIDYYDPRFQAAGCEDLNARGALAGIGILFMEGEQEPSELIGLKAKLAGMAQEALTRGRWLLEKMDAGWERERVLFRPGLRDAISARFQALSGTTLSAHRLTIAARLLARAVDALGSMDFRPAALRKDFSANAVKLRDAAWMVAAAASLIGTRGADTIASDLPWTQYTEALEGGGHA